MKAILTNQFEAKEMQQPLSHIGQLNESRSMTVHHAHVGHTYVNRLCKQWLLRQPIIMFTFPSISPKASVESEQSELSYCSFGGVHLVPIEIAVNEGLHQLQALAVIGHRIDLQSFYITTDSHLRERINVALCSFQQSVK